MIALIHEAEEMKFKPDPPALWNPLMYHSPDLERGKAAVRLPHSGQTQCVKNSASKITNAAAATVSNQNSSLTPPSSSSPSSSASSEHHHSTLKASSDDHGHELEESLKNRVFRGSHGRFNSRSKGFEDARLRYQQSKIITQSITSAKHKPLKVGGATRSPSVGSESFSTSMNSSLSISSAHKAGPQPVVKLPQQSKVTPHRMESSITSQHISQSPLNGTANGAHSLLLSHNQPSVDQHPFTPSRLQQGYVSNPPFRFPNNNQHFPARRHSSHHNLKPASRSGRVAQEDWAQWVELSLKISGLPRSTTTLDLYQCFSIHGNVVFIELYENTRSEREGTACVRFRPPPARRFWGTERFPIAIQNYGVVPVRLYQYPCRRTFLHPSPANPHKKYPESMEMQAKSLEFGIMFDRTVMMTMCTSQPTSISRVTFRQDMLRREITVEFPMEIQDSRAGQRNVRGLQVGKHNRTECFRFHIPFSRLGKIHQVEATGNQMILLISLETPPNYYKKIDPDHSHDDGRFWKDNDAWYRQTDVMYAPQYLKDKPLTLQKTRPIIDLGRWTTYRFVFDMSTNDTCQFGKMREALYDYNVEIVPLPGFSTLSGNKPAVWRFLRSPRKMTNNVDELLRDSTSELDFEARYQLEVCISQGYLNEYNLDQAFVSRLVDIGPGKARDLLEYVASEGKRVFHPMDIFQRQIGDGSLLRSKIPHYCVFIRSATVTPTTVHFQTPVAETSNRIIRHFAEHLDRFLRVRFTDEKLEGRIYATDKNTMNEVFTRVKRVLKNGITIGDRRYEYLASGNSQFRDNGAYFFAPHSGLSTEKIRDWMGLFSEIDTVPVYASRLGQCFSTTRAIHGSSVTLKELADIERNGYNFTDGVGRISPFLAHVAANELGLVQHYADPPSVFQIRLGGCKGILAVSPTSKGRDIHIRKSQYKFAAKHEGLEVIRWSQYVCANLNRQLIIILSALGVPDSVFIQKLRLQLSNLERAMTNEKTALSILQKDIDHNQMTLTLAGMILDGFQRSEEPFLMSLLQLWRAWCIKYLKEKARITIGGGALLFGCVDETGILQGHFNDTPKPPIDASISEKARYVPEVFVQLSKGANDRPEVILGPMLLARNPSLHPGDVRVVIGVDVPELHHLKDVVVLPKTGDRDVASMCSGGDLDGDDFLVIWDQDLLPSEWNVEPMNYSRPSIPKHGNQIDIDDLTNFFVTYMKNDTLASIAMAHLANADYLEDGVKGEKCLKLASLHSMAVDYVKTGQPAQMTRDLKPQKWPHFMEKQHLAADKVYTSRKVLGQLYDQVERVDFVPAYRMPFDGRISEAYPISAEILESARGIKNDYDAHMRRIMAQHEITTEFEVWSTFVLQHSRTTNAFKFHEVIWELSVALKEQFRTICCERAGGKDFEKLAPFVAAMYKVTSTQMADAVWECHQFQNVGGRRKPLREMVPYKMPLMSFPWLFPDVLGKIANLKTHKIEGTIPTHAPMTASARLGRRGLEAAQGTRVPKQVERSGPAPRLLRDDIKTAGGVTHRGDMLELFENRSVNQVPIQATASSSSLPGLEASPTPMSRSPSNHSSARGTSLLDLEDMLSLNDNSHDVNDITKLGGRATIESNLQLLQDSMSNIGSGSDGSELELGKVSNGSSKRSSPPPSMEAKSRSPINHMQTEQRRVSNEENPRDEDQYIATEGSDAEAEDVSISFNKKPSLLDRLADLDALRAVLPIFSSDDQT